MRGGTRAGGTTQQDSKRCAVAWHFMAVQVQTVHAWSFPREVAVQRADLDRLSTAGCEELNLGAWAAEAKSICSIDCLAHKVWHDDRRSNVPVERSAMRATRRRSDTRCLRI